MRLAIIRINRQCFVPALFKIATICTPPVCELFSAHLSIPFRIHRCHRCIKLFGLQLLVALLLVQMCNFSPVEIATAIRVLCIEHILRLRDVRAIQHFQHHSCVFRWLLFILAPHKPSLLCVNPEDALIFPLSSLVVPGHQRTFLDDIEGCNLLRYVWL